MRRCSEWFKPSRDKFARLKMGRAIFHATVTWTGIPNNSAHVEGGLTNGNEANSSRDTARQEDQPSDKIDRIIARSVGDIANFSGSRGVIKLFTIKGRGYYRVYGSLSPPFTRQ